jgi:hypothetical protein
MPLPWPGGTVPSAGDLPPSRLAPDPQSSRAGASARTAFTRRRERERASWRLGWTWWWTAVIAAAFGGYLLIGLTVGPWLGGPMGLLLGAWTGWRLRFRPSAEARIWQRQAATQRRTAATLAPLTEEGYLVLHDVVLPGWLDSLDHLCVHGRWPARASRLFSRVRVAPLRQVAGAIRSGAATTPDAAELASARLLAVLRPAA